MWAARRSAGRLASLVLAAPPLAIVLWLFFVPFLSSAHLSFQREGAWSLRNYYLVWRLYRLDVLYTLGISLASLVVVIGLAVFLCGYLRIVGHRPVEFLFKIPLFVPFVVVGHGMRVLLAPRGTLNSALAQVGLVSLADPPSIAFTWAGIVVSLVWKNLALAVLLVLGPTARWTRPSSRPPATSAPRPSGRSRTSSCRWRRRPSWWRPPSCSRRCWPPSRSRS
jgi:ABC-type sugar transport system permease subunit